MYGELLESYLVVVIHLIFLVFEAFVESIYFLSLPWGECTPDFACRRDLRLVIPFCRLPSAFVMRIIKDFSS